MKRSSYFVIEQYVNEFYQSLDFHRQGKTCSREDIQSIIDLLEKPFPETDNTVNFELWRYSDRHLDLNFRDLDYENPEDLIDSLNGLSSNPNTRRALNEIKGLNYMSQKLAEDL